MKAFIIITRLFYYNKYFNKVTIYYTLVITKTIAKITAIKDTIMKVIEYSLLRIPSLLDDEDDDEDNFLNDLNPKSPKLASMEELDLPIIILYIILEDYILFLSFM